MESKEDPDEYQPPPEPTGSTCQRLMFMRGGLEYGHKLKPAQASNLPHLNAARRKIPVGSMLPVLPKTA